jgi:PAS domain S-box-containing protein
MVGPLKSLSNIAEAAFAIDERGRIVNWNRAAGALLGYQASQAVGRRCYEVIAGRDVFGNRYCSKDCPLRQMVRRGEPIHDFELGTRNTSGATLKVRLSVVVEDGTRSGKYILVHLLRPVNQHWNFAAIMHQPLESIGAPTDRPSSPRQQSPPEGPKPLTVREVQVLRLLAVGASTEEIARTMSISRVTVCNHIQHILFKLEVHSRLQAICIAFHRSLI